MNCKECLVRQFPACSDGIPCCQCKLEECNSRQPCPKKQEENLDYEEELMLITGETRDEAINRYREMMKANEGKSFEERRDAINRFRAGM